MILEGGCGSDTCRARIQIRLLLPADAEVMPPCDACAAAATAVLLAEQGDRLRAVEGAR